MQIIIEDKSVELDLPSTNVALQQVVDEVEAFLLSEGKVPIALSIDGTLLSQEQLDQADKHILTGQETLQFGVVLLEQFMLDQLNGVAIAHDNLISLIKSFSIDLANKNVKNAELLVSEFHHFFEFWTNLYKMFPQECEDLSFEDKKFEEWLNELSDKLKDIVESLEKKDYILASDLVKYELIPAIESAKPAIPKMEGKFSAMLAEK